MNKKTSNGWETEYTLGVGNRLASTQTTTNYLSIVGSTDEAIGTDPRWGHLANTIVAAIRDAAGNMGYATNNVFVGTTENTEDTETEYAYNAAGCLTNLNGISLEWDERYRLTSAVRDSMFDIQYSYDVLNRRSPRCVRR